MRLPVWPQWGVRLGSAPAMHIMPIFHHEDIALFIACGAGHCMEDHVRLTPIVNHYLLVHVAVARRGACECSANMRIFR